MSVGDGIALIVGMVVGAGIFKAPSVVASNSPGALEFILLWVAGGIASLCGALVYAELSGRYPETGGEYRFLQRAWGGGTAFVFAWSRMTVIQTGAIALVAFVFGDYAQQLAPLGAHGPAVYAALAVGALTILNLAGTPQSRSLQKVMSIALMFALALIAVGGLLAPAPAPAAPVEFHGSVGLAMVFVLLTYGGWNEAAYIAGEVHEARRNMIRILIGGIAAVTLLYVAVNLGYLHALGLAGLRESKAVASDAMRHALGERSAQLVALVVCVSALTTMNAAILTGARTSYAFGADHALFARLGAWRDAGSTPANALLLQGALTLGLVFAGSLTPDGFSAMVAYTSPVFWTFFLLTGMSLFVVRAREGASPAFRTPLYPLVPLVFCAVCAYMLWSSVNYVRFAVSFGAAVLAGVAVMAVGVPLYFLSRRK